MSPTTSLIYPWYVTCRSFAFSGKNTVEISNQLSIHLLFATYPVSFGQQLKQRYPDPPPALLDVPKPESDNLSRLSMACPQWQSCSPQGSLRLSPATVTTAGGGNVDRPVDSFAFMLSSLFTTTNLYSITADTTPITRDQDRKTPTTPTRGKQLVPKPEWAIHSLLARNHGLRLVTQHTVEVMAQGSWQTHTRSWDLRIRQPPPL